MKTFKAIMVLCFVFMLSTMANAAGTWVFNGTAKPSGVINETAKAYVYVLTANSSDGSTGSYSVPYIRGLVTSIDLIPGSTAPNAATLSVITDTGIPLNSDVDGATVDVSQPTRITLSPPEYVSNGIIISVSGNTTNSAELTVVVNTIPF